MNDERRARAVHHFSESKNGVKLALNHKFRSRLVFKKTRRDLDLKSCNS